MKTEQEPKLFIGGAILALFLFLVCFLFIRSELKFAQEQEKQYAQIDSSYYVDNSSDPFISQVKRR